MEFRLTEEQEMLRDMVRDFAENEVKPGARERDKHEQFPDDLKEKAAELGLMGVAMPDEWGGSGMDYVAYTIAVEELAKVDAAPGDCCVREQLSCLRSAAQIRQ